MSYVDGLDPNPHDTNYWSRCAELGLLEVVSPRLIILCSRVRSGGGGGGWVGGVSTSKGKTVSRKAVKTSAIPHKRHKASNSQKASRSSALQRGNSGETLQDWFGESAYSLVANQLDALGVEEVADLLDLDRDDVRLLEKSLKKIQAKKFARNLAALANSKDNPGQEIKIKFGSQVQAKEDGQWKSSSVPAQRTPCGPGADAPEVGRAGGGRGTYVDLAFARAQLEVLERDLEADLVGWVRMPPIRGAVDQTAKAQPEWTSPTKARQNRQHWDHRLSESFERVLSPEPGEVPQLSAKISANRGWNPQPMVGSDKRTSPKKPSPQVSSRNLSPRAQRTIARQRQQQHHLPQQQQEATTRTSTTMWENGDQRSSLHGATIDSFGGADTPPMVPPPLHPPPKKIDFSPTRRDCQPAADVNTPWWWPKELANKPPPRSFHAMQRDAENERLAALTPSHQWEEKFSNQHQRPYWYHLVTQETTWDDPFVAPVVEQASPARAPPEGSSMTPRILAGVAEEPDKEEAATDVASTAPVERDVNGDGALASFVVAEPATARDSADSCEQLPAPPISAVLATEPADAQEQHAAVVPPPIADNSERQAAPSKEVGNPDAESDEDNGQGEVAPAEEAETMNVESDDDKPGLWIAARDGRVDVVSKHLLLIKSSGEVSKLAEISPSDGSTALIVAARHGHESIVKQLLEAGADWELLDDQGKHAEAVAAAAGQIHCEEIIGAWSHLKTEERDAIVSSRTNKQKQVAPQTDWEKILLDYRPNVAPDAAADHSKQEQEQPSLVPEAEAEALAEAKPEGSTKAGGGDDGAEKEVAAVLESPAIDAKSVDADDDSAPTGVDGDRATNHVASSGEQHAEGSEAGAEAEPDSAATPELVPEEPEPDSAVTPGPDSDVTPAPIPEPAPEPDSDVTPEPDSDVAPEPEPEPEPQGNVAATAEPELDSPRSSVHDAIQEQQSRLADLSLEAYQDLMDETENHPSIEQIEAAIVKVLEENPELAEQEEQRVAAHLEKRKAKLGDLSLEALQLLNETYPDPSLDQVEAAIKTVLANDPDGSLQALHDASSTSEEED